MPNAAAAIPIANDVLVTPYPPKPGVPKSVKELTLPRHRLKIGYSALCATAAATECFLGERGHQYVAATLSRFPPFIIAFSVCD
jgi:hypothetical protein